MKRPLMAITGAFVLGEVIALCNETVDSMIMGVICMIVAIGLFWINGKGRVYLLLPIFIAIGYIRAYPEAEALLHRPVREPSYITLIGEVTWMEQKTNSYLLHLKTSFDPDQEKEQKTIQVLLYLKQNPQVKLGNMVQISGELASFPRARNPGQFDSDLYYRIQGISYQIYGDNLIVVNPKISLYRQLLFQLKNHLSGILKRIAQKEDSDLYHAILLGEKNTLDMDVKERYQRMGIAHILVISGLHISILGMGIYSMLRKCGISFLLSSVISAWFMVSFGMMTGEGDSIRRALIMFLLHLMADIGGRTYDMATGVSVAALALFWDNPLLLGSSGVQLSFTAILGIAVIAPHLADPEDGKFRQAFLMSLSIQFLSLPISIFHYHEYPTYGILINLIILPFMSLCVYSGMVALFFGWFSSELGSFWIGIGHYILEFYSWICKLFERIPFSIWITGKSGMWKMVLYYGIMMLALLVWRGMKQFQHKKHYRWGSVLALTAIFYFGMLPVLYTEPSERMELTFLDVGQGDSLFIRIPKGNTYLIDGGSLDVKGVGVYRIEPFLKYRGVSKIDYVIITHLDSDHISGIQDLLMNYRGSGIKIGTLVLSELAQDQQKGREIVELAAREGIDVQVMKKGDRILDGKGVFTCLHPGIQYQTESDNDGSIVLRLEYGDFRGIFTGDLEKDGEDEILQHLELGGYTLLKAGHHGSKTSSSESFLQEIQPNITIISCGEDNRFGHPHGEVITRLSEMGSQIYRTDQSGAITVETDGIQYWVSEFLLD